MQATREQAARAFEACAGLDPEGRQTPAGAASVGQCFQLVTDRGSVFWSVTVRDGIAWVNAAAGGGGGMAAETLQAIEQQARGNGCHLVGFQTLRRGLMRIAKKQGYEVARHIGTGAIFVKDLV